MKIRDYLTEETWCKGALAKDSKGKPCSLYDPDVARRCLAGAANVCYSPLDIQLAYMRICEVINEHAEPWRSVVEFNDRRATTWLDVKSALDKSDV